MSEIDLDKLRELSSHLYTSATRAAFGDEGLEALRLLVGGIVKIYRRMDPGSRAHPLVLFAEVGVTTTAVAGAAASHCPSIATMHSELDGPCMARVNPDQSLDVFPLDVTALASMSKHAVVYHHFKNVEKFVVNEVEFKLFNVISSYGSVFCKPTFTDLATALDRYRAHTAANSSCEILKAAWNEPARWFLKQKPERIMRKSLNQFLSNVLVDAEVRPEQNVDETHPVDIKVTFSLTELRAIIEIKWLGESVDETGKISTGYAQGRAVDGSHQLAKYLDSSHQWAPGMKTRGYLVVFDARRKGLASGLSSLPSSDALHYKDADIVYTKDYHAERTDFARPVRMYMFPVTT